jgi:DNA-binding response OmpR family regulator
MEDLWHVSDHLLPAASTFHGRAQEKLAAGLGSIHATPIVSAPKAPEATRKRILIAEDDPAIATMLLRVLGRHYEVEHFATGKAALARASAPPPPNLMLLDVMMPELDGFSVATGVRGIPHLKQVPIIFLTARTAATDIIKGIQNGARHYIQKPFSIDDVLAKVKKTIGE